MNSFGYKNDDIELSELGQFIREAFDGIEVLIEWYVIYDDEKGFLGILKTIPNNFQYRMKNPDIIIRDKNTKEVLLCYELDGSIHDVDLTKTWERNKLYDA